MSEKAMVENQIVEKPKKKRRFKKFLKVVGIVFASLIALIIILVFIFNKLIFSGIGMYIKQGRLFFYSCSEYEERHLTKEQMLSDFEYLYDHLYTNSLVKDQAEKYLDFDYDKIYEEYKERISNCEDEYEFYANLVSLNAKLPGGHSFVAAPQDHLTVTFPLGEELGNKEVINTNYSYYKQFEDRMFSYDQKFVYFCYLNGEYITLYDNFDEEELISGIKDAKLLTLDGKDVNDMIGELDTIQKYGYDAGNDRMFVSELVFNDGVGTKYVAEIELPDGTIVTKDLYNCCEHVTATYFKKRIYPDCYASEKETQEENNEETEETEGNKPSEPQRCYSIQKVPERNLVIVSIAQCVSSDTQAAFDDITAALKEVDATTVIIDNRNNKGGTYTFATKGICSAIISHDYVYKSYSVAPKNDLTDLLYSNTLYSTILEDGLKRNDDNYTYYENFSFEGKAEKEYDIYVLNGASTFSSGDILAGVLKDQPNVTTIGNNTGGEGYSGHPMDFYLPESKFPVTFSFSVSVNHPDDNYLGTTADVFVANGWDSWMKRREILDDPNFDGNIKSFENRLKWDEVMIEAVRLMDSKQ